LYNLSKQSDANFDSIMITLNEIDGIITTLILKAETNTCSMKDRVYWSPEIHQSNLIIQYWNIFNKSIRQQINCIKRLRNIWKKWTMRAIKNTKQ
jgi:hypothetical protein